MKEEKNMEKILFLTTLLPLPPDNGGKIKSLNTLKALSKNYNIDLFCFVNDKEDLKYLKEVKHYVSDAQIFVKRVIRTTSKSVFIKDYLKSWFSILPYSIKKFYSRKLNKILSKKINLTNYNFVYVDHLPMMVYYRIIKNQKIILDEHNVESMIFKRIVQTNTSKIKKVLGHFEYIKLRNFEISSLNKCNQIICLSVTDKLSLLKLSPSIEKKISILPIHLDNDNKVSIKKLRKEKINLLFLGTMSWYPNQQGIKWFMENVWPSLISQNFNVYIVGSNPPDFIKEYQKNKQIIVTGYVNNIDRYIQMCDVSIVPLFIGSGQRVKIIESFAKGIPVLSTTIGAEGLICEDGKDIFIANNKHDFISKLQRFQTNHELLDKTSYNARITFDKFYSAKALPQKLNEIISKLR